MKKFFKILLWIIIPLIFIGTFIYLFKNSQPKADSYELVSPVKKTIERTTVLTGKIEPRDEIEIKPQISGIISEILVEPGDRVNNGDIIAKIKVIPDATQLSSAENRIQVAKISLEEARLTYERTKALYDKKYESREKFETDRAALRRAEEELSQAKDQLRIVKEGVSQFDTQGSNTLIRSTVTGFATGDYSAQILKVYPATRADGRNLLLKITDPALLEATGGIVQGMSGSPILQNG